MNKTLNFLLIILLLACNQTSNNNAINDNSNTTEEGQKTEEEIISNIRSMFEEINSNSASYETKSMEIMDESAEGGELNGYYQNGELKKAVASYFGEMGKSIEEYYFSESGAFFVFTQQYFYDKPISVEDSKVEKTEENRYYFHDGKLLRWLDPNKEKVAGSNFGQKESEILQKVKALTDKLAND